MSPNEYLDNLVNTDDYLPHLSINCVVFGFNDNRLKVLLIKLKGVNLYSLPAGYVLKRQSVDEAAQRILLERTGLENIFLEQFAIFGETNQAGFKIFQEYISNNGIHIADDHWILRRFVSIGYYTLVNFSQVVTTVGIFDDSCEWYDLLELPDLSFDHPAIIQKALETLRLMLDHKLVGSQLLPETFTMRELQMLHETILGQPLRRDNFQRKMLSMGILQRVEKKFTGAANKAPYLYRFVLGNS